MKILFAASEGVPFCKTGGLADVVGALPVALAAKRHAVRVVLPFYRQIRENFPKIKFIGRTVYVPFEGQLEPVQIWQAPIRTNLNYNFVDAPKFFDRPGIYGDKPGTSYPDNDRRYAFFSRAVLELARGLDFRPDIIHGHDWQTGPLMAYLKLVLARDPFFSRSASIFTIHNMAYQGNFPASSFAMMGLPVAAYNSKEMEFYGNVSFMKSGLVYADALNTVSPTYAKEVSTDKNFGCGMEGVLQERAVDFEGIVNGLDVDYWNPKTDTHLAANFTLNDLAKRAKCKADLQKAAGFSVDAGRPLLGFIGRLDNQKGVDLVIEAAGTVLKDGVQVVSLGQGQPQYVEMLRSLERRHPAQVFVMTDFAEPFAHKIYAGSDIFLMPSRYEPCGLGQLIAMRYGAVPVVTPTGGLLDTVKDSVRKNDGTGFVAKKITSGEFLASLVEALEQFKDPKKWRGIQERGMRQDLSWKKSVNDYISLYESVLRG